MTTPDASVAAGARAGSRSPVLVAGGTGFVGRHLVRRLVDEATGYVGGAGRAHARRCVLEMAPRIPAHRVSPRPAVDSEGS